MFAVSRLKIVLWSYPASSIMSANRYSQEMSFIQSKCFQVFLFVRCWFKVKCCFHCAKREEIDEGDVGVTAQSGAAVQTFITWRSDFNILWSYRVIVLEGFTTFSFRYDLSCSVCVSAGVAIVCMMSSNLMNRVGNRNSTYCEILQAFIFLIVIFIAHSWWKPIFSIS